MSRRVILPPPDAESIDVTALYKDLAELGYGYGPTFQGIKEAWHAEDVVWARAALPRDCQLRPRFAMGCIRPFWIRPCMRCC